MLPSEYLNKAADMLEKPGAWCRGTSARDAEGNPTSMGESNAVQHCMDGALYELSIAQRKERNLTIGEQINEYKAAVEYLEDAVKRATTEEVNGKKTFKSLVKFNDDPEQKQEYIVNFLRATAKEAAASGK